MRKSTRFTCLLAAAASAIALVTGSAAAAEPARDTPVAAAPYEPLPPAEPGHRVIADSQSLVLRADAASTKSLSDLGEDEAATIWAINRKHGTYQSYLLYTAPGLPTRLFHPGFTITLPPPGKKQLEAAKDVEPEPQPRAPAPKK